MSESVHSIQIASAALEGLWCFTMFVASKVQRHFGRVHGSCRYFNMFSKLRQFQNFDQHQKLCEPSNIERFGALTVV